MELDDDGVREFALATLVQACIDVRAVYTEIGRTGARHVDESRLSELKAFFYSDQCADLLKAVSWRRNEVEGREVIVPDYGGNEAAGDEYMGTDVAEVHASVWVEGFLTGPQIYERLVSDPKYREKWRRVEMTKARRGGVCPRRKKGV